MSKTNKPPKMKILPVPGKWWERAYHWGKLTARQLSSQPRAVFEYNSKRMLDVEFIAEGCNLDHKTKQAIMTGIKDVLLREMTGKEGELDH
jgi:hypothetical protein